MNIRMAGAVLVMLALWFGYEIGYQRGYQRGVRNEQRAWAAVYHIDSTGKRSYNTWPGAGRMGLRFQPAVNAPDPRAIPVKSMPVN